MSRRTPPPLGSFVLAGITLWAATTSALTAKVVVVKTATGYQRFRIEQEIGIGSYSTVHLGVNLANSHERVAIKLSRESDWHRDGFDHELAILKEVEGTPTIPRAYGIGAVEGEPTTRAFIMEWAQGARLGTNAVGDGTPRRSLGKSVRIAMQLARALSSFHAHGIRHNDLNPMNIHIDGERSDSIKLLDVGHASPLGQAWHGINLHFRGPEISDPNSNVPGPTGDIYQLGAILVNLLTGKPPTHEALAEPELDRAVVVLGQVLRIRDVAAKAMNPDPAKRYQSAQELLDALRPFSVEE
jgi:serine/threonine-protein kinase